MINAQKLPALAEVLERTHVVAIPTRTRFRGISVREAAIFAGPKRFSEFSPFPEYGDAEASAWLRAGLEFGWQDLPTLFRERISVNATVPAISAATVPELLARFAGCKTAKVKVAEPGQTLQDDISRVAAVRETLGDTGIIRIDANGAWDLTAAKEALNELKKFRLDYAEQPVMSINDLAKLRQTFAGEVKIAADESVRKASDPLAVAKVHAADILVVKAQPLGGINRALEIITAAGMPVVVSSALDTSVGISMGAHLAAALPAELLHGACGLGTATLLAADVTRDPLLPKSGAIPVHQVVADPALLRRYAAEPERKAWWQDRIKRCYKALVSA